MSKKRNRYTPDQKVNILKEHFLEKKAISDICDTYKIHPMLFYKWQKQFFENGHLAFDNKKESNSHYENKITQLENKLAQKNEVVSELMEEYVTLKKKLGAI